MTRRQRRSLTPEFKLEASRHMQMCLYGEFQGREDFYANRNDAIQLLTYKKIVKNQLHRAGRSVLF